MDKEAEEKGKRMKERYCGAKEEGMEGQTKGKEEAVKEEDGPQEDRRQSQIDRENPG